ncbi:MAG TPA: hypothetical protein VGM03_06340, partial [Phycisphaerae bacterium]
EGNVGIGTDEPLSPLHLLAPQAVTRMVSSSATNGSVLVLQNDTASPAFLGAINFQPSAGTPGQIAYTGADSMTFRVNGTERMRIDDDGKIGIGTATPGSKLHVVGSSGAQALTVAQANNTGGCGQFTVLSMANPNAAVRGVHLDASGDGVGVYGEGNTGVYGFAPATTGVTYGVQGWAPSWSGRSVYGLASDAPAGFQSYGILGEESAQTFGYAVFAIGDVGGTGGKSFRIDHPDDPANKYLLHYCAESPEIINFYSGTVTLDAAGAAVVELPAYFSKINRDPRYLLTPVGAPMPMLHVADPVSETALLAGEQAGPGEAAPRCWFRIAGGAPGAKVCWEVKALRNDRWIQNRGAPVEMEKPAREKGTYQHPELYRQPLEKGMNYEATRRARSASTTNTTTDSPGVR